MFDRLRGLRQAGRDVDRPDVYSVLPGLEGDIHARAQRVVAARHPWLPKAVAP